MDALSLLREDHDKAKKMLEQLDSTTERGVKTRQELFTRLKGELEVHEAIEEEIFYPALREQAKARELVLAAYEEHNVLDTIMAEILETPFDDEAWGAKFSVMKENLEHHIDEEEGPLFTQARSLLGKERLESLGAEMEDRKKQLMAA
jgi:hemerythrin-like domain-containing protein